MLKLFCQNFIPVFETAAVGDAMRRRPFAALDADALRGVWESVYFADPSKTEQPTHKKLSDARKKGQVPKSTDLVSSVLLLVGVIVMSAVGSYGVQTAAEFLAAFFENYLTLPVSENNIMNVMIFSIFEFAKMVGILFIVVMVIGVAANIAQTGFLFTTEPLKPKFSKLNPITGFKNIIFTKKALFNLAKSIAKCGVAAFVAYRFIVGNLDQILQAPSLDILQLIPFMIDILVRLCIQIGAVMLIIAIIDLIFQRRTYKTDLKMTKQEVKEESKQMEGNPEIKGKRRQKQMQMAINRMFSAMNTATVVVTNPTHYAIAIKYVDGEDDVPVIIAKGADYLAARIREAAKEYEIPIVENKPLARALYSKVEVGDLIPAEFFKAIAEILVQVMKLKKRVV